MLVAIAATAQNNGASEELSAAISAANNDCPMDMGIIGRMTAMTYNPTQNTVVAAIDINPATTSIDLLNKNRDIAKQNIALALADPSMRSFTEMLVKSGSSMTYAYRDLAGNKRAEITLSHDELKNMLRHPMTEDERCTLLLENQVEMEGMRCPYEVAQGMTMEREYLSDSYLVYVCVVDESLYDIAAMKKNLSAIKSSMQGMFNDVAVKTLAANLYKSKRGLRYVYRGNKSKNECVITFTADEIKNILR